MTVPTNTGQSYSYNIIREDLENIVYKISPLEVPVFQSIGRKGAFENTYHEWPVVELAAANGNNAQVEGDDATNDATTTAFRFGNYSQIFRKTKGVSTTDEAIRGAGDVQKMAKQVLYATQEIKRDIEARIAGTAVSMFAVPGNTSTARQTAAISAFINTNALRGAGGAAPTLSGGTNGYPNAAETAGTARAISESLLKTTIQNAWTQGGNPTYAFCSGGYKVIISGFTGNVTRYQRSETRELVTAIDVYDSDFGQLQIVPDRFQDTSRILVLDPGYVEIGWVSPMRNVPLARTGLSDRRMIYAELGVVVGNQKAHGMIADLNGA